MATPRFLEQLHDDLSADLAQIAARFKNAKITLIVRSPDLADGDVVLTDDNLELAVAALRKLENKAMHVIEPRSITSHWYCAGCGRKVTWKTQSKHKCE